jgi:hypothetical protein
VDEQRASDGRYVTNLSSGRLRARAIALDVEVGLGGGVGTWLGARLPRDPRIGLVGRTLGATEVALRIAVFF